MARLGYPFAVRCIVGFLSSTGLAVSVGVTAALADALERSVHRLVNEHRVTRGLKPSAFKPEIAAIARHHSRDMATGRVGFGHRGFDTRRRAVAAMLRLRSFGENVGWSQDPGVDGLFRAGRRYGREGHVSSSQAIVADDIVAGWLSSPSHRKNIESPDYELTGVGVEQGPGGEYYFTQLFVRTTASRPGTAGSDQPPSDYQRPARTPRREKDPRTRPGRKRIADGWAQTLH